MPKITDPALLAQLNGRQGGGMVQIAPPDPKLPGQVQGQNLDNAAKARDLEKPITLGDSGFMWDPKLNRAVPVPGLPPKPTQNTLDPQKLASLRAAQAQIDRMQTLFAKGPGATKGVSSLLDFLPSPTNAQFDTAGAGLGEVGLAAFRVPGVGSQSDAELRAFIDANRPRAADFDARIKEKLRNLQTRLDQTYSAYGMKRQVPKNAPRKVIDFSDLPE